MMKAARISLVTVKRPTEFTTRLKTYQRATELNDTATSPQDGKAQRAQAGRFA